jgi:glycosyltransferase involved in cell wall biosynthesis
MKNISSDKLVSLLIPIYNVRDYLPECLDSVISQTYSNIEIVLVDDGSNDGSEVICDNYQKKDKRIVVYHQKNKGQSVARNLCIDKAKGEFFVFVDSDDVISPTYVETLCKIIEKYKCKIAVSVLETFKDGTIPRLVKHRYQESLLSPLQAVEWMNYQEKFDTWPVCKLYHRSIFDSGLRYPSGLIFEDFALTYLLILESDKVAYCNKVDYYYRLRDDSTEGEAFSEKKMEGALNVLKSMEEHRDLLKPIIKSYKCRMISFAYHMILKMPKDYNKRYIFEDMIKRYRLSVLFDNRARKKARLACLVSFCGFKTVEILFRIVDRRR